MYFINHFEMVADALLISDMTFVFIFHTRHVSLVRSSYHKVFSAVFLITLVLWFAINISKEPWKRISPPLPPPLYFWNVVRISLWAG